MAKTKFIRAKEHVMVGHTGAPTDVLAPGERVRFNKDADSHRYIASLLEEGDERQAESLEIVEIDLEAERKAEAERKELLEKAEKIAADQREDQLAQEQRSASVGDYDPTEHNVSDVIDYLRSVPPGEVERVKALEADSERDSTQIAGFEAR